MESVLLKCRNCGTVNRVTVAKFDLKPKCHSCKNILDWPKKPVDAGYSNFQGEVAGDPGAVLVEFWSPTCGYCRSMSPLLDELASEKGGIIKIVKINSPAEPNLSAQFNIMGVPSFVLFNNGQKVADIAGAMNKDQLLAWIRQYINV
jgi:thioredoxin 2